MSSTLISRFAIPHCKQTRTYVDVGANDGDTSHPFVDLFDTVVAFEPNPNTFKKLITNTKIQAHQCALLDHESTVTLQIPNITHNPAHGSVAPRRQSKWQETTSHTVQGTTLDSFKLQGVDLIKIDVEQGELEVIRGALNTIMISRPVIMFENKRNENQTVIDLLLKLNYHIAHHLRSDVIMKPNKQGA